MWTARLLARLQSTCSQAVKLSSCQVTACSAPSCSQAGLSTLATNQKSIMTGVLRISQTNQMLATRNLMTKATLPTLAVGIQQPAAHRSLLAPKSCPALLLQSTRTKVYNNRRTGKPVAVKAVYSRFFRLHNGMWIRTKAGRHKRRWKKSPRRLHRAQQHVFLNKTQCQLLDKMVTYNIKRPRYYVDDPYEHYHKMSNLPVFNVQKAKYYP